MSACLLAGYTLPTVDPDLALNGGAGGAGGAKAGGNGGATIGSGAGTGMATTTAGTGGQAGAANDGAGGQGGQGGMGNGGAGGQGGMAPTAFCDKNDATLLACFRFNGNFDDESGAPNFVTNSGLSLVAGMEGQAADFQVSGTSSLYIADAPHWDVTEFTAELWVSLRSYPTNSPRMGLFDSDGRYGLFIYPSDEVRCTRGDSVVKWTGLKLNTWTHVACVLDADVLRLYINGNQVAEAGGAVPPAPFDGINALGSNAPSGDSIDGIIDNFRVWNVPRSAKQICEAAGNSGC